MHLHAVTHRAHTLLDYDRIAVIDDGKVVEYDTPIALLSKKPASFSNGFVISQGLIYEFFQLTITLVLLLKFISAAPVIAILCRWRLYIFIIINIMNR